MTERIISEEHWKPDESNKYAGEDDSLFWAVEIDRRLFHVEVYRSDWGYRVNVRRDQAMTMQNDGLVASLDYDDAVETVKQAREWARKAILEVTS